MGRDIQGLVRLNERAPRSSRAISWQPVHLSSSVIRCVAHSPSAGTPSEIWDQVFDISGNHSWLSELLPVAVPRTYSISNWPDELLPGTAELTVSGPEYDLCLTFSGPLPALCYGVGSSFLNPLISGEDEFIMDDEELLLGVSRPLAFQLPIDDAAPCAFFARDSGIAPFRSFWQARAGRSVEKNILFHGVQS